MNKNGVVVGDVFYLSYCGVNVFLEVNNSEWDKVYAFELDTKKIDNGTHEVAKLHKPKKDGHCLVTPHTKHNGNRPMDKANCFSPFIMNTAEGEVKCIFVEIGEDSELMRAAKRIDANNKNIRTCKKMAFIVSDLEGSENWYYDYNEKSEIPKDEAEKNELVERVWEA